MYYTQSGQEIEDPEMDAMRRDIEESLENGDFPEIEDLKSTRLGATVSAQFDETNGTLLLATNETQVLLSALETQALLCFLHDERDALYVAVHKEMHSKYI